MPNTFLGIIKIRDGIKVRKRYLLLIPVFLAIVLWLLIFIIFATPHLWREPTDSYYSSYNVKVTGLSGKEAQGTTVILVPIPASKDGNFFTPPSDKEPDFIRRLGNMTETFDNKEIIGKWVTFIAKTEKGPMLGFRTNETWLEDINFDASFVAYRFDIFDPINNGSPMLFPVENLSNFSSVPYGNYTKYTSNPNYDTYIFLSENLQRGKNVSFDVHLQAHNDPREWSGKYFGQYDNTILANVSDTGFVKVQAILEQSLPFDGPGGIAVDSSGNVYVADSGNNRFQKFNSDGKYLTQWGSQGSENGQFNYPTDAAVDSSGNVYATDTGNHRIQKFNSNGKYLTQWGSQGSENGQFNGPGGVAVDSSGNVYVADTGNHRIQKFDSNGKYLTQLGSQGSGNGQFNYPTDVAIDSSGNIYAADTGNYRADENNHRIQKFDSDGKYLTQWGSQGSENGQFNGPGGVAVDSSGSVYVADTGNHRIQKFDSNGKYLTQWGSQGSENGQFNGPGDIAVDSSGNVYVADSGNNLIQKFNSDGNYLTQWNS